MLNTLESAEDICASGETHEILIPEDAQTEGSVTLIAWLKQPGDAVEAGEPVAELETDKITLELISPVAGVLVEASKEVNEAVQQGEAVGRVLAYPLGTPADKTPSPIKPDANLAAREEDRNFVPYSAKQKVTAERVSSSLRNAAHVTCLFEADLSGIVADRESRKPLGDQVPSYTAYILYAAVQALKTVPEINGRYQDEGLEILADANPCIAMAVDESDLVAPVLHKAQTLSFQELAKGLQQLAEKARSGQLGIDDLGNGSFTVSSHGAGGSLLASPIVIFPPQIAALGIGKIQKRPVVVGDDDRIEARTMAYITLTIDHRVMNGARANAYMRRLCEILENWPQEEI